MSGSIKHIKKQGSHKEIVDQNKLSQTEGKKSKHKIPGSGNVQTGGQIGRDGQKAHEITSFVFPNIIEISPGEKDAIKGHKVSSWFAKNWSLSNLLKWVCNFFSDSKEKKPLEPTEKRVNLVMEKQLLISQRKTLEYQKKRFLKECKKKLNDLKNDCSKIDSNLIDIDDFVEQEAQGHSKTKSYLLSKLKELNISLERSKELSKNQSNSQIKRTLKSTQNQAKQDIKSHKNSWNLYASNVIKEIRDRRTEVFNDKIKKIDER